MGEYDHVGEAMPDEPIIDAHTHFFWPGYFPPEWFRAKAEQWGGRKWPPPPLEGMPGRIERGLEDPDATLLLKDLDHAGVETAVCIGIDPWPSLSTTGPNDIRSHVQRQVDVLRSSDRLRGFVGVDPRREGAADVVRWAISEAGFCGVKIYTPHGYHPDDEACRPIYRVCVEFGVPVMYHTAQVQYPLVAEYANPLLIQAVQHRFPELTIILGHAGFPLWLREAALVAGSHPRTYLEVSMWQQWLPGRRDELTDALAFMKSEAGAHRMLFGSDHHAAPLDRGRRRSALAAWTEFARTVPVFEPDERRLFLSGNIARLLGWMS
jgi:predicted TIM-barrel fold metal-dependent hydrolase